MRFNRWEQGQIIHDRSLCDALQLDTKKTKRISIVGAGGKTTMAYCLAAELSEKGYRVIVATTTHMKRPAWNYIEWEERKSIPLLLKQNRILTVGVNCENEKITTIPKQEYPQLAALADVLIIEADGSRRLPVKVPAKHEPVIYPDSDLVIGVLGYHSIGHRIAEIAYRPEELAQFLNTDLNHQITAADLIRIAESGDGLRKQVTGAYQVILNQCHREDIKKHPDSHFIFCEKELDG